MVFTILTYLLPSLYGNVTILHIYVMKYKGKGERTTFSQTRRGKEAVSMRGCNKGNFLEGMMMAFVALSVIELAIAVIKRLFL